MEVPKKGVVHACTHGRETVVSGGNEVDCESMEMPTEVLYTRVHTAERQWSLAAQS